MWHSKWTYIQSNFPMIKMEEKESFLKALFSSIFFYKMNTVRLSFVFNKYYPIIELKRFVS